MSHVSWQNFFFLTRKHPKIHTCQKPCRSPACTRQWKDCQLKRWKKWLCQETQRTWNLSYWEVGWESKSTNVNECQGMSNNLEMIQILKILTYFNPEPGTFSNRIPASERVQQKTKWPLLNYFIVFCYFCSYSLFVIHHNLWSAWSAWSWRGRVWELSLFSFSWVASATHRALSVSAPTPWVAKKCVKPWWNTDTLTKHSCAGWGDMEMPWNACIQT